ncbi:MAG TPA: glycine cleavage system aminomethyltransferase GcvT, partial [Spirochaetota bacterium]|nr:glycine cleavage system aminomethyltransferase GcvT [Spirochaetota bacterium]
METVIKKTCLYDLHKKLQGSIIDFHGVYLPVFYTSIQEEHQAERTNMGIFDVSHMGNVYVT